MAANIRSLVNGANALESQSRDDLVASDVVTVTSDKAPALRDDIRSRFGADAQLLGDTLRIEHKRGHELATQLSDAFGDALLTVTVGRPTLNDVFVKRTGHHLDGAAGDSDG